MTIAKAIIPAAGLGTRLAHISKGLPKEMLPLAGKPMIVYSVEEAIRAQILEICIVISKRKQIISEYVQKNFGTRASLTFLYQQKPQGLADAIYRAKDFVGKEPFAILLPDNIFISDTPAIKQLYKIYNLRNNLYAGVKDEIPNGINRASRTDLMGCIKVGLKAAPTFGNSGRIEYQELPREGAALFRISRLYDKKAGQFSTGGRHSTIRTFARFISGPHMFNYIEKVMEEQKERFGPKAKKAKCGKSKVRWELDDVPVLQKMIEDGRISGVLLKGKAFDAGNPAGYKAADEAVSKSRTPRP